MGLPFPSLPDPFEIARRALTRLENALLDRVVKAGSTAVATTVDGARHNMSAVAGEVMTLLGKLPHTLANGIVDLDRGTGARRLTGTEMQLVVEAYGARVAPADVRIVRGAGLSVFATIAFMHGNPAITIGNTMYLKSDLNEIDYAELSNTMRGLELLLHEYTHVVQYATLGFGAFGKRYVAELRAHHNDPNELYAYETRNNDWQHETLEGQAQIVGDYTKARHAAANPMNSRLADQLRAKLAGTGIYAQ